jgi:hypothetical protein
VKEGICPLCREQKPICLSHLIPEGMYKYIWQGDRPPIIYTSKEVGASEEELTAYLLCQDCENLLNRDGENWLLPKLAQWGGTFPLHDMVTKCELDWEHRLFRIYACGDKIAFRKITNFVIGVFWKAAVHPWGTGRTHPRIELGKYREEFRKFLNHEAPFPKHVHIKAVVAPPEKALIMLDVPSTRQEKPYHIHVFNIPGMTFVLGTGRGMEPMWSDISFYSNKKHPVMVADMSERILGVVEHYSRKAERVGQASRITQGRNKG